MACCSRSDCKSKNEIIRVEDEIVTDVDWQVNKAKYFLPDLKEIC